MLRYPIDPILAKILSRVFENFGTAFFIAMFATPLFEDSLPTGKYYEALLIGTLNGILFLVMAWQVAKLGKAEKKGGKKKMSFLDVFNTAAIYGLLVSIAFGIWILIIRLDMHQSRSAKKKHK